MAFKMKGFSGFTKKDKPQSTYTDREMDKKAYGEEGENQRVKDLKDELFSLDNPNSKRGKQIMSMLEGLGVDLTSGNYDEID